MIEIIDGDYETHSKCIISAYKNPMYGELSAVNWCRAQLVCKYMDSWMISIKDICYFSN